MSRPNILWICTDQQRYDTLGCYGNEFVETPNIDRLASEGVRFEHCFSQSPVCTPSRASFLTGRYPRTTRCRQNGQAIPADETLLTSRLANEGYVCGLSGKLHLSPCNPEKDDTPPMGERRIDDGYALFRWSHGSSHPSPVNQYHLWLREHGQEYDRTPVDRTEYVQTSMPAEYHQTTWCAQQAMGFIEAHADSDEPWLFSLNTFDPHHAFDPPAEYLERYLDQLDTVPLPNYEPGELDDKPEYQRTDHHGAYNTPGLFPAAEMDETDHRLIRAAYWAMCDLIDEQVGRVLDVLEETNQRQDTLVVFTSDHGEMLGDHGLYLKGPFFYEPAVRVPLIVSQPGTVPTGVETDALVELVDLAPTLVEAANLDSDSITGMQGQSFWSLLTDPEISDEHRNSVYSEYYNGMPWHEQPERPFVTMVRTDRYKLVRPHRLDTGELYDLEADSNETTNLWDNNEYAAVKSDLLTLLSDRMAETVDPLPERQAPW